jgi:oligopeptidase A
MPNPLLENHLLPPFVSIQAEHVEPAISELIEHSQRSIDNLLAANTDYNWDNLMAEIEELEDTLTKAWSPVGHLNAVMNTDELRSAYNACLPMLSAHSTWMGQHQKLCAAYQQLADSEEFATLELQKQTAITQALRDFKLAGVSLPEQDKKKYGEIKNRLSKLSSEFSDNVLDATNAWSKLVSEEELSGLPPTALAGAKQRAQQAGEEGYLINLEFPSFQPVMTYCNNQALREEVYQAFSTRASSLGPQAGQWDNSANIEEILTLRQELAQLLGFENYAEVSLATKMADSTKQVMGFLDQLAGRTTAQARKEWQELKAYALEEFGQDKLNHWDVGYYSEKMRIALFELSQEDIRPYLPAPRVLLGMFEVVNRLYGVDVKEITDFESYHPDLRLFEISRSGEAIAGFYLDMYARPHKRGGAWMDDCRSRRYSHGSLQLPVAYLTCNFTPPVGENPALLSDAELTTLFHEFGHGLHHMLTAQSVSAVSGINGVAWDAVELPSQFMENWCWEKEALAFISGHFETDEPLPEELLSKMLAAKNFHSAMAMVRQLEFALFDFRLHIEWAKSGTLSVQALADEVRSQVAVVVSPPWNRFQNSFSHIFGGGYAAGYYSYKWAEVLSADAFSKFEEEGIFNRETGASFQKNILEMGGARDAMDSFVAFREREPDIEPLLRHCGING